MAQFDVVPYWQNYPRHLKALGIWKLPSWWKISSIIIWFCVIVNDRYSFLGIHPQADFIIYKIAWICRLTWWSLAGIILWLPVDSDPWCLQIDTWNFPFSSALADAKPAPPSFVCHLCFLTFFWKLCLRYDSCQLYKGMNWSWHS